MCDVKPLYFQREVVWPTWPVWPEIKKDVVPEIERVIFHGPATIVYWSDSTKTVVKCMEGEEFDEEKGIAMAFMKKMYGDKYKQKIRRHIPARLSAEEWENVKR